MTNRKIFEKAQNYLLSFNKITPDILQRQCEFPGTTKSIPELYKKLLEHASNRRGMPNSIGDIDKLKNILFEFNPEKVFKEYNHWEKLFDKIKRELKPTSRMQIDNKHNYWVIYCKSVLSVANYLNKYSTIKSFNSYVNEFISSNNIDIRMSLPLLMKEELFGFQFALACDFVKENISPEFIKPDVHIKDIFKGLQLSNENANDFEVFRDVIKFAKSIDELPYKVDKVFWLIGSGKFYIDNIKISTDKFTFIKMCLNS
ncbi:MAG: hypothetical protein WC644_01760 [Ignavibacteria bacterium]